MATREQRLHNACVDALIWWHSYASGPGQPEPNWLEQMRAIPGVRDHAMNIMNPIDDEPD
ncbi:hypothetical protein LCGC14_1525680 [marine sediment metagenome]|uniref:Uncharacterized protein n=1 Tax=marine sediment metagenome TaxID=412755 RepID=A0A0F9JI62_9ZZZZ